LEIPAIDHVVIDVGEQLDEAARRFRSLGFHLTERSQHTLGSANHLAMFDTSYLELLSPGNGARPELMDVPIGMNGLVFAMDDAQAMHDDFVRRQVPAQPVQNFSRNALLPDGTQGTARFSVVRQPPRTVFDGRVYFCQHLTPELVWRPEWQDHPNGAVAIAQLVIAADDPQNVANGFDRLFGAGSSVAVQGTNATHRLMAGGVPIEIWPSAAFEQAYSDARPQAAGRASYLALWSVRVRSVSAAAELLRRNGVPFDRPSVDRLLVPAAEGMNVALELVA